MSSGVSNFRGPKVELINIFLSGNPKSAPASEFKASIHELKKISSNSEQMTIVSISLITEISSLSHIDPTRLIDSRPLMGASVSNSFSAINTHAAEMSWGLRRLGKGSPSPMQSQDIVCSYTTCFQNCLTNVRLQQPSKFLMCTTTLYAQVFGEFVAICRRDITGAGQRSC